MFTLFEKGDLKYYKVDEFSRTGLVRHCFSTRHGGVSKNEFFSMNLRINCDDKRENILKNYSIICEEIGVDYENLVLTKQVHEDKIYVVNKEDRGNGITKPQKFESCDALITAEKNVPIAVFSADCVPVFFLDTKKSVIALAHSGWKGTVARISEKVVNKMCDEFGSNPKDILCAIGPSINVCHFEVGDEVSDIFLSEFGPCVVKKYEKNHVDMQKAIEIQLKNAGILEKNIINSQICTQCRCGEFFSHRVTGDRRGVQAAIMELI